MRITDNYVFFWKGWLSNFWRAPFILEDKRFFCTEQYFMYKKAELFEDTEIAEKILNCTTPQEARSLGRRVRGYNDEAWSKVRERVMYRANLEKYKQNPELKEKLLDPIFEGKSFVEAAAYDNIWAIGISEYDPKCEDPKNWKGLNLLGKILDAIRQNLKNNN